MNIPELASSTEKRDGAYEMKFILPAEAAETVLVWARKHLSPDPHGGTSNGDGYRVNSLYFDTPKLDVYQRNGSYGKAKYRVRRYGSEANIFLERKLKSRGLVSKRRTRIPDADIFRLVNGDATPDWIGYWFRRRLLARRLFPKCQIRYQRVARVGETPEGPVRLTLDREVSAFPSKEYHVYEAGPWKPILPDQCILELKFRNGVPILFKSLIDELQLTAQPVSKYRLCIQAAGLDPKPALEAAPSMNGHASAEALAGNTRPVLLSVNGTEDRA